MTLLARVALQLFKCGGYSARDVWDSWRVILLDQTGMGREGRERTLETFLLHDKLQAFFDRFDTDLVVDVGACVGRFARLVRKHGYCGRILSCEPIPALASELCAKRNVIGDTSWSIVAAAVGLARETRRLNLTGDRSFSSFALPNAFSAETFGSLSAVTGGVDVSVEPLEALLDAEQAKAGQPFTSVFVKSDTQGFDVDVIRSLGRWRDRVRGIMVELPLKNIYEGAAPFATHLAAYDREGFALADCMPVSRSDNGALVEIDGIFVDSVLSA